MMGRWWRVVHEHIDHLRSAIEVFATQGVDQVVVLGDLFEMGQQILPVCELLMAANAIGVWGNHDFGLCVDPSVETLAKYPAAVLGFMSKLCPRLELDGCHFSHIEPWLDPNNLSDLWYLDGPPDNPAALTRIFGAVAHRISFVGHYHRWLLATPQRVEPWRGDVPVQLREGQRYFVAVGALCDGDFCTFDTQTNWLVPLRISS